jgi:hypothetical protein
VTHADTPKAADGHHLIDRGRTYPQTVSHFSNTEELLSRLGNNTGRLSRLFPALQHYCSKRNRNRCDGWSCWTPLKARRTFSALVLTKG